MSDVTSFQYSVALVLIDDDTLIDGRRRTEQGSLAVAMVSGEPLDLSYWATQATRELDGRQYRLSTTIMRGIDLVFVQAQLRLLCPEASLPAVGAPPLPSDPDAIAAYIDAMPQSEQATNGHLLGAYFWRPLAERPDREAWAASLGLTAVGGS